VNTGRNLGDEVSPLAPWAIAYMIKYARATKPQRAKLDLRQVTLS
jgi:hypothetical protein